LIGVEHTKQSLMRIFSNVAVRVDAHRAANAVVKLPKRDREMAAYWQEQLRKEEELWVAEGRKRADYKAGTGVLDWRQAKAEARIAAENAAWLRDHPGNPLPEHLCSLVGEESAAYEAWLKKRSTRQTKP
jgi:hypothetical protein